MRFMAEVILRIIRKLLISSRVQILIEGSTNDVFFDFFRFFSKSVKYIEYYGGFYTPHSTGLSLGNQVDGLPGASHTEALWGGQGLFGPAPIGDMDKKNVVNI